MNCPARLPRAFLTLLAAHLMAGVAWAQEPARAPMEYAMPQLHVATFAGGCFWCMEPPFEKLPGVISVTSGYMGGTNPNPTYEEVSSGATGYLEVVQVSYDAATTSYQQLLETFWMNIDPTQADGQFADKGSQYRTAIFCHTPEQRQAAEASKAALAASGTFATPIVTEIRPATAFYPAEASHQDYYKKNPIHYTLYRIGSGREGFLKRTWGERPHSGRME